ncbi:response regulator transcription factor [Amycolatopsis anabasis]|uniref:response regulator transcription factor n=1 Tax=Amycolatopsis anabasis TaxID=1840409 RepID=UPI00131E0E89|nr:response regulator transcription factor [Amycolatopsis anabasis]
MPAGVAVVVDRIPAFRAGLAAILEDGGFEVVKPERPEAWLRQKPADAVLVTLHSADEAERIRALLDEFPDLVVVAVLPSAELSAFLRALRAGAHAAVGWGSSPDEIVDAVRSAMAGHTRLPTAVAQALAKTSAERPRGTPLLSREVHWLRVLASGGSVVQLARAEGYSQREIFRRLSDIYRRMGARNRHEAIALAGQWGLLVDEAALGSARGVGG